MNIDRELVARALVKAGEEPITNEEWQDENSNRVRVVKEFYHAVLLESLSSYDWTSQKKRARLEALDTESEEAEENLTGYAYMYPLPADCAKVVKLANDEPYIVEGAFLFADVENAVLLYIRNYFTGKYIYEKVEEPNPDDIDKYYVIEDGEYVKAESYIMGTEYYVIKEEDYNFYAEPELDPSLSAYFECKLAANLALKLTGGADKYQMLYNEAELIANKAQKKSSEQAQNKTKGNAWWTDQLGLTSGGEIHAYN